jgi:hypothetical protein
MLPIPKIYYNVAAVEKAGEVIAKTQWSACTIPGVGIFFSGNKDKVPTSLYKHEFYHWKRGVELGFQKYFFIILTQYYTVGYKKSPEEKAANAYAQQPLTAEEQSWIV